MAAIEAALEACQRTKDWAKDKETGNYPPGKVMPEDVAVAAYIVSNIDRATGECARHYETVAKGCGMSRSAAGRSIKRLVDAGVIERAPRFARNRAQIATAFKIGADIFSAIAQRSARSQRPSGGTPPSHERDTNGSPSRDSQYPDGGGPSKIACQGEEEADWSAEADWLFTAGKYAKHGFGAEGLAQDDLDRWRCEKGDRAILKAIEIAKAKGLHGERLSDFLENTWPDRNCRAAS